VSAHKFISLKKVELENIKDFLDSKVIEYNNKRFIEDDPISIPHKFNKKQDIEIAGLFAATIAWGNRKSIIKNANSLIGMMDFDPHNFVMNAKLKELKPIEKFVHRTFNGNDAIDFLGALKKVYAKHDSLEQLFLTGGNGLEKVNGFRLKFIDKFKTTHALKHVSNPATGSAAKRLNMYLRWMVRNDKAGVDFGIWRRISSADLMLPLDIHTGNTARKLGLLKRKQDDDKAVEEITNMLKLFDANDPVKYDFALFGLGVFEKF
jgi:uncharacterized protein (TIGR02757 family)